MHYITDMTDTPVARSPKAQSLVWCWSLYLLLDGSPLADWLSHHSNTGQNAAPSSSPQVNLY